MNGDYFRVLLTYKITINNIGVINVSIKAARNKKVNTRIIEKITSLNKYLHSSETSETLFSLDIAAVNKFNSIFVSMKAPANEITLEGISNIPCGRTPNSTTNISTVLNIDPTSTELTNVMNNDGMERNIPQIITEKSMLKLWMKRFKNSLKFI